MSIDNLSKDDLIKMMKMFSKDYLALDGLWFLGVEDKYGLDAAIQIDLKVWERLGSIEVRRIKQTFDINEGGIASIVNALQLSPVWICYGYEFPELMENKAVFRIINCVPQEARVRNNRGEFPCKPVDLAYMTTFAKTIDPKAKVRCIQAPPDRHLNGVWCEWEILIE